MLANYLIRLREGLEAALVVSILVAYLVKVERRDRLPMVAGGVCLAVVVSVSFGALLTYTSTTLLSGFRSQEVFGGTMSALAVVFVTWMVFWMRRAARGMRAELDGRLSSALRVGAFAVGLTAFLAVAREGLETALFFWSAVQAAGTALTPILGFSLGIATAVVLAWLLYRRSVKLNMARFFTWTSAGLIVIAAGVLAYAVHDLQEGGVISGLTTLAFDVRAQIPPNSWYGALLKGIFNLSPQTTVAQAVAWVAYLVPVIALFFLGGRTRTGRRSRHDRARCHHDRSGRGAPVGRGLLRRTCRSARSDRGDGKRDHVRGRHHQPPGRAAHLRDHQHRRPGHRGLRVRDRRPDRG